MHLTALLEVAVKPRASQIDSVWGGPMFTSTFKMGTVKENSGKMPPNNR